MRAELIVVGARGAGSTDEPSLGSVARNVAHHATIPVLVVRRGAWESHEDPLRVLLASDGSPSSHHTCQAIHDFTWPEGSLGQVITIAEPSFSGQIPEWLEDQLHQNEVETLGLGDFSRTEEEQRRAHEELRRWCGPLPPIFADQEPLVAVGRASEEILKAAQAKNFDLVVVGSHTGAVERWLLGGTSERVLTHAPCPVLIVRRHEKP
jgi:nucleotide-binding universal stress UspA family protein